MQNIADFTTKLGERALNSEIFLKWLELTDAAEVQMDHRDHVVAENDARTADRKHHNAKQNRNA